ncbi:hypothetical protein HPP92_008143 [Vanilla planifolia]|uniref:Uncharacterized protein n=1 Tax=Vanilla planifolia TaxID=51239 RepID=A0A835RGP9_VANPL|nr:hypothetical protein HPP92_008143 [Vanilla planifolia]
MFRLAKQMPIDQLLVDHGPVMDDIGSYQCDLCDAELVHKIAQPILSGLSAACVDSTTGDFFRSPAMVAIELRKEMVDYITQRSETCISRCFFWLKWPTAVWVALLSRLLTTLLRLWLVSWRTSLPPNVISSAASQDGFSAIAVRTRLMISFRRWR